MVTCYSPYSRNHRLGIGPGQGTPLPEAQRALGGVAEAVPTTRAARALAARHGLDLPIIDQAYAVLFEGKPPLAAMTDLLARDPTDEMHGIQD